ncbi:MAG: hypothetical protein ACLGIM_17745 [Alphaproteobacteria bacterium]|jgi:hypothetical protein
MVKVFIVVRHDGGGLEDLEDLELHFIPRHKDELVILNGPGVPARFLEVLGVRQIIGATMVPTVFCRDITDEVDQK